MGGTFVLVPGDISEARVEVVVNAWNRNFIPYWLLIPQGVAKALRKKAGVVPFREVRKFGLLGLGEVVETSAGEMAAVKRIFHVAALHAYWSSSPEAIAVGAKNIFALAAAGQVESLAIPLLGAGTGRVAPVQSLGLIANAWEEAKRGGYVPERTEVYVYESALYRELFEEYFRAGERWEEGVGCLERRAYWEAHEAWEAIWSILPASGLRRALQALIQFAAACYKVEQVRAGKSESGMQRGMAALIESATEYLRNIEADFEGAGPCPGFDLAIVRQGIDALREVQSGWRGGTMLLEAVEQQVAEIALKVAAELRGSRLFS